MYYQFAFNMTADGQHAVVLEYKLSAGNQSLIASIPSARTRGLSGEGIYKNGPRPTGIFIHWKDLPSGQEFSRDVDFQGHLDEDLNGAIIYVMINGERLYVYLVLPTQKAAGQSAIGPRIYNDRAVKLIYSNWD